MEANEQTGYDLSPQERAALQELHQAVLNAAQTFQGALIFLGKSQGIPNGTVTPDFTRLLPPGAPQ